MKEKEIWYKQLGFHNNPFSIKPAAFYDELLGYEHVIKKVNNAIANNKLIFVEGDYGNGKSTLLRRILHRFGGKGKIIYFSCNRIEDNINVNKLLKGRYGVIGKLLNLKPKNMILLLDEAHWLPKEDYGRIKRYYRGGYFRAIVFVGKEYDEHIAEGFNGDFIHIKLGEVNEEHAKSIVRKRVGNLPLLSDDVIKSLFARAEKNVRKLLKYAELVCREAIERGDEEVTEELIGEVIRGEPSAEEPKKPAKKAEKGPAKKAAKEKPKKAEKEEKKQEAGAEKKAGMMQGEEKPMEELRKEEAGEILEATPADDFVEERKVENVEELYY